MGAFTQRGLFYGQSGLVNPEGAWLNSCPVFYQLSANKCLGLSEPHCLICYEVLILTHRVAVKGEDDV